MESFKYQGTSLMHNRETEVLSPPKLIKNSKTAKKSSSYHNKKIEKIRDDFKQLKKEMKSLRDDVKKLKKQADTHSKTAESHPFLTKDQPADDSFIRLQRREVKS